MMIKFVLLFLLLLCALLVIANDDYEETYEPADEICEKCNCTNSGETSEDGISGTLFTVDCSMKSFEHIFAKWPELMGEDKNNVTELNYIMSFNDLMRLQQFPTTNAIFFFTCRHCKISKISAEAFIDVPNIHLLDLSFNKITSLDLNPDIFRGPHSDDEYSTIKLENLDLSHNAINFLDENLFEHTPHLKKLSLSYNELKNLEQGTAKALASLHNLEILDLSFTSIIELSSTIFENMKHLSELFINGNHFTSVPVSLSLIGASLEYLHLSENPIDEINTESFSGLIKLEQLNISGMSELTKIDEGSFSHLRSMEVLIIKGNKKLSSFNMHDTLELTHLKKLEITANNLITLDFGEIQEVDKNLEYFKHLHELKLAGNPWKCDCKMMKALEYFNHNATYYRKAMKEDEARCATPSELLSKLLYTLPLNYVCAADQKAKPLKIPVYDPPQFIRPKSIMLTVFSVVVVVIVGIIIGFIIVCIKRRLKSNQYADNSNPIRYTAVRDSTVSNVVNVPYQQP